MTNKTNQDKRKKLEIGNWKCGNRPSGLFKLMTIILLLTSAGNYSNAQMEGLRTDISQFDTGMDVRGLMDNSIQVPDPTIASIIGDGKIEPPVTDSNQVSSPKWYSRDSRQGRMTFTASVFYKIPGRYDGEISDILTTQHDEIMEVVDSQVQHMFGAFTEHPNFTNNPGIPSGDYKVTLLGAENVPGQPYAKITYSFSDMVVFAKELFNGANFKRIEFVLPKDPTTIYNKSCTDDHYNSEGDFWYFWNPYKRGCSIKDKELMHVEADVQMMDITHNTYPEYNKLYEDGVLQITYLVGIDKDFNATDTGAKNFPKSVKLLEKKGFKVTEGGGSSWFDWFRPAAKRYKRLEFNIDNTRKTVIDMYLVEPGSSKFAELVSNALQNSDVFIYNGHSGLGGYLSPRRISNDTGRTLSLPKNKYQVYFFHGCSTYAYYNKAYFKMKKSQSDPEGTKNLDIMTTAIGAYFLTGPDTDATFIESMGTGKYPSWQTIIDKVNESEQEWIGFNGLTHVNGDEDNPQTP